MAKTKQSQKNKEHKIPLRITDTTLRDAHQSLWATRLRVDDIMEVIDVIDSAGYYSLEMWGGATFDVCLRYLRENPWERLRKIKSRAKKTPLQMLLRGQNIVGYKNYADDLLDRFISLAVYNGIDIFRVFDALNDTRNLEFAITSIKKHGAHAQGTLSYTISPYHSIDTFVKAAKEQAELGIDTLCVKDMAGILSPIMAEKLVTALTEAINVPIQLHCHSSSGMAYASYVEGVRAGAGAIDCAISPVAGFSSQPPVETMVAIFNETEYSSGINLEALREIAHFFQDLVSKMECNQLRLPIIDPDILLHQIPGGMISNLRAQLDQQKALDRLDEVLAEVPRVRADLGFPPLVTPTSQIVGTQAVLNILSGERYSVVPVELKNYVKGLYGRPPKELEPVFIQQILGKAKPITHRPADDIEPMLPKAIEYLDSNLVEHEEDVISYCLFPEQALEFFRWRKLPKEEREKALEELTTSNKTKPVETTREKPEPGGKESPKTFIQPEDYKDLNELLEKVSKLNISELIIRKGDSSIAIRPANEIISIEQSRETSTEIKTQNSIIQEPVKEYHDTEPSTKTTINSPFVGKFYTYQAPGKPRFADVGDTVAKGATVCIVEVMKLINEIKAPVDCKIIKIFPNEGESVEKGQPLIEIEKI
jgi:oxaloacetate decarboxylase (Na+ extruding) subunit alpha